MKRIILFLMLAGNSFAVFPQADTLMKCIFIPHPRSDDQVHQSVLPGIEAINFDPYDMIMLGGDLTYYTSSDRKTMEYCDSLFDLGSSATLWTLGNHDLTHPELIEEFTGRPSYYCYTVHRFTFLVLDTEQDANGFSSSHISGDQLEMVQQVCDTISHADYLVLLHHRLLWMIGNEYFLPLIDSVAQSTRQLDTSNFNTVVFPLLQKVKERGVRVLCLGGDRSDIIIDYSPEDSITYIASPMVPEFPEGKNSVVILNADLKTGQLSWEFVPLSDVEKNPPVSGGSDIPAEKGQQLLVWYRPSESAIGIELNATDNRPSSLGVFAVSGQCIYSGHMIAGEKKILSIREKGCYLVWCGNMNYVECQRVCVY